MEVLECIYERKSIRQFTTDEVPHEVVRTCLEAAIQAPSPKHQQNWHFVVVENRDQVNEMARLVTESHLHIAKQTASEKEKEKFMRFASYYTLFKKAPVVVLVYAKPYDMIEEKILKASGAPSELIDELRVPQSAAQGVGAAVENFLLAATAEGYGACYMTGPTHARREIEALIGFEKEQYSLMALIAMGKPIEDTPQKPTRKPFEELVTFIK